LFTSLISFLLLFINLFVVDLSSFLFLRIISFLLLLFHPFYTTWPPLQKHITIMKPAPCYHS
jgi:hypothetical protein